MKGREEGEGLGGIEFYDLVLDDVSTNGMSEHESLLLSRGERIQLYYFPWIEIHNACCWFLGNVKDHLHDVLGRVSKLRRRQPLFDHLMRSSPGGSPKSCRRSAVRSFMGSRTSSPYVLVGFILTSAKRSHGEPAGHGTTEDGGQGALVYDRRRRVLGVAFEKIGPTRSDFSSPFLLVGTLCIPILHSSCLLTSALEFPMSVSTSASIMVCEMVEANVR